MKCKDCINHLTEKNVEELGDDDGSKKIKKIFNEGKGIVENHIGRGEKPVFCVWSYIVIGSKSVCADIEVLEEDEDE